MITVTPSAADIIRQSAEQGDTLGMPLRIAVTRRPDGDFHYALGFDEQRHEGDTLFQSEGIDIVVAPTSLGLVTGTVIDYVEIEGKKEVIFINPNDPAHQQKP